MKRAILAFFLMMASAAWSMPLGTAARTLIPKQVQQIVSVDYRALKDSTTAIALKEQVLPDNMKQFETALKGVGINPDKDLDQLTFASYRLSKNGVQTFGVAQGPFPTKAVMKKLKLKKIKPTKYFTTDLFPMGNGMLMTFLDDNTLAFGNTTALHGALDARDGRVESFDSNTEMTDLVGPVEGGPVWSILDQKGTQNMMRSALGQAAGIADFETVKKRLLGSRYTMSFTSGVNFDLDVVTADSVTASTLSALVKGGMLYRKLNASPSEKVALDSMTVESSSSNLQLHFKTDDQKFQALMHSDLFATVSH